MDDLTNLSLESDRLQLEPLSLLYRDEIFREFTPEIAAYMHPKPPDSLQDVERFIKTAMHQQQQGTDLTLVILHKADREFLGVCALHRIDSETPEFGIWLKAAAHGCGYGREAIHRLKAWADDWLTYEALIYPVAKANHASRNIAKSLNGRVVREFQQMNLSGTLLDEVEYRIYP